MWTAFQYRSANGRNPEQTSSRANDLTGRYILSHAHLSQTPNSVKSDWQQRDGFVQVHKQMANSLKKLLLITSTFPVLLDNYYLYFKRLEILHKNIFKIMIKLWSNTVPCKNIQLPLKSIVIFTVTRYLQIIFQWLFLYYIYIIVYF